MDEIAKQSFPGGQVSGAKLTAKLETEKYAGMLDEERIKGLGRND